MAPRTHPGVEPRLDPEPVPPLGAVEPRVAAVVLNPSACESPSRSELPVSTIMAKASAAMLETGTNHVVGTVPISWPGSPDNTLFTCYVSFPASKRSPVNTFPYCVSCAASPFQQLKHTSPSTDFVVCSANTFPCCASSPAKLYCYEPSTSALEGLEAP